MCVVGEASVRVQYEDQSFHTNVLVVKDGACPLFGRDWLFKVRLNWSAIRDERKSLHSIVDADSDIVSEFADVFSDELGCISGYEAQICLSSIAVPKCVPARPVPYAIRSQVDRELDRLESEGILEKVDSAEWSSPIVIVKKSNGDLRLCGDFKVTINQFINPQQHPIPNPTDLLASLSGGTVFSKLDLRQAYAQ